jgi:Protein of unknown function (DUF664)
MTAGGDEHQALLRCLRAQRRHVMAAIDGLDDDTMTRAVQLPSGWTPVQLIHHLSVDDERFWFSAVIAGERDVIDGLGSDGWTMPPGLSVAEVIDLYTAEAAHSDTILQSADLDASPSCWPDDLPADFHLDTIREVALHVLAETAAHAGHLDAARELIDGYQWVVAT